ncbi:hypothetical protein B7494_g7235 [Chlorociboria aeruginascens]|nr:hypothetical protein B7494_g7235 [Chlorociboria aeruginascens]
MLSFLPTAALTVGFLATIVVSGPVVTHSADLLVARSTDLEVVALDKRIASIGLGNFSLTTSHQDDVLFNINLGVKNGINNNIKVECVDCRTWGTAVVSTTGVEKDESIIGDIISFFENPLDTIVQAFDLDVKVDLQGVGGSFDFDITITESDAYSFNLFKSETPVGIALSDDVTFGVVLLVDLVFSLSAKVDLEAGFSFSFPDGAFVTIDPLKGTILNQSFAGGSFDHLPVTVNSGSATLDAALRITVQGGTTVKVFGTGFDFEVGVTADLIEYKATLTSTPQCLVFVTELVDVNIGAFARAVGEIDYKTFGVSPTVVTTIVNVPLPSLCITNSTVTSSTVPPVYTTAYSVNTTRTQSTSVSLSEILPTQSSTPVESPSSITSSSLAITTSGGVFFQNSTSVYSGTAARSSYLSGTEVSSLAGASLGGGVYSNTTSNIPTSTNGDNYGSTITSAPSLIVSTIQITNTLTITHCASTVLNCPASLASEIFITTTIDLYTTICPAGAIQPTTFPAYLSQTITGIQTIANPTPLSTCETPIVQTLYSTTFDIPTYTIPAAYNGTVYASETPTSTIAVVAQTPYNVQVVNTESSAAYIAPLSTPAVASLIPSNEAGKALQSASTTVSPPIATPSLSIPMTSGPVAFTGAASRDTSGFGFAVEITVLVGMMLLML